jgi:acyl dehydratase
MTMPVRFELQLTAESLARWRIGRDGVSGEPSLPGAPVPLSYLVFLRAQPVLGCNFHDILERDPDRGLYGGVAYRAMSPLEVGQSLQAVSDVQERRTAESAHGTLTLTTLLTTYRCRGEVCATESVRMVDLPPGPRRKPAQDAVRAPRFEQVATIPGITRSQIAWLTVETGDVNALHLDGEYAKFRGFDDVVVPATLMNALFERELAAVCGLAGRPAQTLDVRYHGPTFPGEPLLLHARQDGNQFEFEAFVGTGTGASLRADGRAVF